MSFNNNLQSVQERLLSCENTVFEPYMLGGGNGVSSGSVPNRPVRSRPDTVRDCLCWNEVTPNMNGNAANLGGGNAAGAYWTAGSTMGPSMRTFPTTQLDQDYKGQEGFQFTQPKAFVSVAGKGQGEAGINIPCQIAPIGTNPTSLLQSMEPVTVKVTSPPTYGGSSDGGQGPMTFTINPGQLYGNMQ